MARKKKITLHPFLVKSILIAVFAIGAGWILYASVTRFFQHSSRFQVKAIVLDPRIESIRAISNNDLSRLLGKNIFVLDLRAAEDYLQRRYPQVSDLKVVKRFPDQIFVTARKRIPVMQLEGKRGMVTVDERGVVVSLVTNREASLPLVAGVRFHSGRIVLGETLSNSEIRVASRIIHAFSVQPQLVAYRIEKMNVSNLSKIVLRISNGLDIIVDRDTIVPRMDVLGFLLSQPTVDPGQIKYIDLRFNEPIMGKK